MEPLGASPKFYHKISMMKILFAKKTRIITLVLLIMCMMLRAYLHDDTQWLVFTTGFSIGYLVAELLGAGREKKQ